MAQLFDREFSREHPGCVLFLLDQSGSMSEDFGKGKGEVSSKKNALSIVINRYIETIVKRCVSTKADEEVVFERLQIGAIGYGGQFCGSAFTSPGLCKEKYLYTITELYHNPLDIDVKKVMKRVKGGKDKEVVTRHYIWVKPHADGPTPMGRAFDLTQQIVSDWTTKNPESHPPIVINITDGEATDCGKTINEMVGNLKQKASAITQTSTNYGPTLLYNCHISSSKEEPVAFCIYKEELPKDVFAQCLYDISSHLTPIMVNQGRKMGFDDIRENSKGFAFNAKWGHLVRLLEIGTRIDRGLIDIDR